MTNKKASKILGEMDFELVSLHGPIKKVTDYCEACCMGADALKSADKYRWHNLKKYPNDLPETFVEVWVCFTDYKYCGSEKFYDKAGRRDEDWCWEGDDTLLNERYQIIAWKYIEPFEV